MTHRVLVPPLGQTTDTVILSAWYKHVGDTVNEGEPLFAIETDKATLDIEAPASGVLAQRTAQPGDSVTVLSSIGMIAAGNEQLEPESGDVAARSVSEQAPITPEETTTVSLPLPVQSFEEIAGPTPGAGKAGKRLFISPRARRLAEAEAIELRTITGTGPEHAIVERDVRRYLEARAHVLPAERDDRRPTRREAVPPYLGSGQNAVLSAEIDASAVMMLCERLRGHGLEVSPSAIMLYVLSRALKRNPLSDAVAETDVTVGVPAHSGFATRVIRNASSKPLMALSRELAAGTAEDAMADWQRDQPRPAGFAFVDLGRYGIDTHSTIMELGGLPALTLGRPRRQSDGHATVWLSLSVPRGAANAQSALKLMQSITQLAEDPDLLL